MAVNIRNPYVESRLEREAAIRGEKTLSGVAMSLITERLTQLEMLRGPVLTTDVHPAPSGPVQDIRTHPIANVA